MLTISKFKTLFLQSRDNDEGLSNRQKKTQIISIPGMALTKKYSGSGGNYDRSDGWFLAINAGSFVECLGAVMLPKGATMLSIQVFGSFNDTWQFIKGDDSVSSEIVSGTGPQKKKINVIVDNAFAYWFACPLSHNNIIGKIDIEYVI